MLIFLSLITSKLLYYNFHIYSSKIAASVACLLPKIEGCEEEDWYATQVVDYLHSMTKKCQNGELPLGTVEGKV